MRAPRYVVVVGVFIVTSCFAQRTITFDKDRPDCQQEYVDGDLYRTISTDSFTVGVMFGEAPKAYFASVSLFVHAGRSLDLLPQNVRLRIVTPKAKELRPKDPRKIIAGIDRAARWNSAMDQMGANMSRQQATTTSNTAGQVGVTDNHGNTASGTYSAKTTSTTSQPDYDAQRAAQERTMARQGQAELDADTIGRMALRATTVHAGGQTEGTVWFDKDGSLKKHGAEIIIEVPIGDTLFDFPLRRLD